MSFAGLLASYTSQPSGQAPEDGEDTPKDTKSDDVRTRIPGGKLSDDRKSLILAHKLLPSLTIEARFNLLP